MTSGRGSFLATVAGSLLAGPSVALAQAPVPLKIGVIPVEVAAQTFYAADTGIFQKYGLDVSLEFMESGGAIAPAVVAKSLDVGISDYTSMIRAHARGLPFVYLTPGVRTSTADPAFAIVVPGDSPIHEAKDFNGKTLATNGIGTIGQLATEVWIDRNGGDWQSVKWLELPLPATLPALQAGRADGSPLAEPWLSVAKAQGYRLIFPSKNAIAPYLGNGWMTTTDWVRQHPDAAKRFVGAMHESARWANAHHDAVIPILAKYTRQDPAVLANSKRYFFADSFSPAVLQLLIDATARYGFISQGFPASELLAGLG